MPETVPGGSVCPNLNRLGDTQTGNDALNDWLAAIKIVRRTSTATTRQALNVPKILRGCSLYWQLDLTSTFMGVLLPGTLSPICRANKSETEISAGPHTASILTRQGELPGHCGYSLDKNCSWDPAAKFLRLVDAMVSKKH